MDNSSDKNIKEDFCPVCIASVPLAFALVSSSEDSHEQEQKQKEHDQKHKKKRSSSNYIYPLLFIIFCIAVFYYFKK
jgi:hypothetical protein